ncbi:MAG: hypothetical protein L3J92_03765 [Thermoplasmata archaeon]|nr:hypothetical protein [Thermoplasmata archaeon]
MTTTTTTTNISGSGYANIGNLPLGVAILALLIGIFGFFVLVGGLVLLVFGTSLVVGSGSLSVFGTGGTIAGLILVLIGAVILAVASGLWDQELWALALAVIVLLFYGAVELVAQSWVALLVVAALLVYLVAVSNHFD